MASLRRLSIDETSIFRIRPIPRQPFKAYAANHHCRSSQSGKPYTQSSIYSNNTNWARSLNRRSSYETRTYGSWSRWKASDNAEEDNVKQEHDKQSEIKDKGSQHQSLSGEDRFFDLLKHDAAAAYRYLHRQIEQQPYRWIHDPKNLNAVWDPSEWWAAKRNFILQRRTKMAEAQSSSFAQAGKPSAGGTSVQPNYSVENEEFRIDPITMKKVYTQKVTSTASKEQDMYPRYQTSPTQGASEIPTETSKAHTPLVSTTPKAEATTQESKEINIAGFAKQPWLVREGFTSHSPSSQVTSSIPTHNTIKRTSTMEPSLDRMSNSRSVPVLEYPPREKTTDDVDLLRANDIRAAAGRLRRKQSPSPEEIENRNKNLSHDWQRTIKAHDEVLSETYSKILEKRKARSNQNQAPRKAGDTTDIDYQTVKQHYDDLRSEINETAKILQQARKQVLHDRLSLETDKLKSVFDNFDTRSRKQISVLNDVKAQARELRDSTANIDNQTNLQEKLAKLKRDQALVAEIRNIYEQKYGKITTEHRQHNPRVVSNEVSGEPYTVEMATPQPTMNSYVSPDASKSEPTQASGSKPVRDLLYESIEDMAIPETVQKRLKFALRGVPELDDRISVPGITGSNSTSAAIPTVEAAKAVEPQGTTPPAQVTETTIPVNMTKSTIDQPTRVQSVLTEPSHARKPEEYTYIYKILALDNASNEVAVATTTSSIKHKSSVPRSAAGLLVHLDQPAKYFMYMEQLDAEGFQLVSGSRTMLVYRRRIHENGHSPEKADVKKESRSSSRSMNPLREEAVFSGHLQPKERLLRSYQLAHRRARSNIKGTSSEHEDPGRTDDANNNHSENGNEQSTRSRFYRGVMSKTGTVVLAVTVCYVLGLVNSINERRSIEEGVRLRQEEAALKRAQAHKNDWSWFY